MIEVRDNDMEALNLITFVDIYKCTYDEIINVWKNYSRVSTKRGKGIKGIVEQTSMTIARLTKVEIKNMLEIWRQIF